MSQVAIVTDSACDLSPEMAAENDITVIPLVVRFGAEVYFDGEMSIDEFWQRAESGPPPQTSQPPVGAFSEAFERLVSQGKKVVCPVISSRISGTYNAALIAAQNYREHVTVFDTATWSLMQGYQALQAAAEAAQGRSVPQIVSLLESIRERSHALLCVDTIEYLNRGGRAQIIMPTLKRAVSALSIKPILQISEGKMRPYGVARSRLKAMRRVADEIQQYAPVEMAIVAHTRALELAKRYAAELATQLRFPLSQVMIAELGPALASHAGPGAFAAGVVQAAAAE